MQAQRITEPEGLHSSLLKAEPALQSDQLAQSLYTVTSPENSRMETAQLLWTNHSLAWLSLWQAPTFS